MVYWPVRRLWEAGIPLFALQSDFGSSIYSYFQFKVWVKPNAEQQFLYGNNILKSGVGRITEGVAAKQGVVVFSMNETPLVSS